VYYARDQGKNRKYHSRQSRYNIGGIDRGIKASDGRITAVADSGIMEIFIEKKTLHPTARKHEDVIKNVRKGMKTKKPNPGKLVFIDEISVNLGMARLYGRAKTNERANDYVPDVRFERTSIMARIRLNGKQSQMTFKGTLNGQVFAA
jgi:hypothetical protein